MERAVEDERRGMGSIRGGVEKGEERWEDDRLGEKRRCIDEQRERLEKKQERKERKESPAGPILSVLSARGCSCCSSGPTSLQQHQHRLTLTAGLVIPNTTPRHQYWHPHSNITQAGPLTTYTIHYTQHHTINTDTLTATSHKQVYSQPTPYTTPNTINTDTLTATSHKQVYSQPQKHHAISLTNNHRNIIKVITKAALFTLSHTPWMFACISVTVCKWVQVCVCVCVCEGERQGGVWVYVCLRVSEWV